MPPPEPALRPEPWPWRGPRVLVEDADETRSAALAAALRRAGYAVAVCSGPSAGDRCPLASGEGCAAALGADVVVSSLGVASAETREVLDSLRAKLPWTRLIVGAAPVTPDRVAELVRAALAAKEAGAA